MNTPGWLEFIGDRNIDSVHAADDYIVQRFIPTYEQTGCGFWCVVELSTKEPIGTISMIQRENLDEIDLGFAFLPKYEGNGFAFEASQAILEKERKESGLQSVLAFTDLNNQRSRKLLSKLGFSELGLKIVKPEWGESLLYRLVLEKDQ
ncbi:MAG: GNAT family N-acetyltransferase [Gammaproteobacteria bacterium]|nr:GNAT family N-acetyltransferase [Gammaproteobacteria bacterium]NNC97451.1 GNAT family N-acetyltransferase [Gammaproteobacteria bacterium]NNM12978.1 GNAT family N-acetyltransferase [Gammaproteobacteria bacterium]